MIEYFDSLHIVVKLLMGFTILGMGSLIIIFYDRSRRWKTMSKEYKVYLKDHDIDYLHDDYVMVEVVIDQIVRQVRQQGYKPPSERENNLESEESA